MSDVDEETANEEQGGDGAEQATEEAEPEVSALAQLEAERDKLKDQLLRTAADFDNFRKRSRKDLEQAERRGKEEVLRELLPVFDNLERAVQAAQGATDLSGIQQGLDMVLKLFDDASGRLGLERVKAVGERFDPSVHDAFQQMESAEHPPGTILTEYQAGYRLGDKLVRPAMVVVAKKPAEPKTEEPKGDSD